MQAFTVIAVGNFHDPACQLADRAGNLRGEQQEQGEGNPDTAYPDNRNP